MSTLRALGLIFTFQIGTLLVLFSTAPFLSHFSFVFLCHPLCTPSCLFCLSLFLSLLLPLLCPLFSSFSFLPSPHFSSLKNIPNTPKKVPYKASNESPPLLRALYTKTLYPQPKLDLKKIDTSEFMLCFVCSVAQHSTAICSL